MTHFHHQQQHRRHGEEQLLTTYTEPDMSEDWQFKIVYGNYTTREKVEAVMSEQAEYGWKFVEKFDDTRIRFKRSATEALNDAGRSGNPYKATSDVTGGCAFRAAALVFMVSVLTITITVRLMMK